MRIIFLNTWNGKMREGITEFIKQQSASTDIFYFQEAYHKMEFFCKELLPRYKVVTAYKYIADHNDFPQATYLRENVPLLSSETILEKLPGTGLGIYTEIKVRNTLIHLCNFHDTAKPGEKMDTPERLSQSQGLLDFLKEKKGRR